MIRVRFAPSPTGYLHIGGARTALFNWMYAKAQGGQFVLRIEDTDQARSEKKFLDEILESMQWLGMTWDEIYHQGERFDLYKKHAQKLLDEQKAYREGEAVILKIPQQQLKLYDIIRGEIAFDTDTIKDQVLMKSDGSPAYSFACVVDDALMKISCVIRGEDHISNTPKQMMIYQALGFKIPKFAHLPLILGSDGGRLSKRTGAVAVSDYRKMGFLPEAVVNYLMLLGWSPGANQEKVAFNSAIKKFSIKKINKAAAMFSLDKLKWLNAQYIKEMKPDALIRLLVPFLKEKNYINDAYDEKNLVPIVKLFQGRLATLTDFLEWADFIFLEKPNIDQKARAEFLSENRAKEFGLLAERLATLKDFNAAQVETIFRDLVKELGIQASVLVHPIRVALTGRSVGPGLFETMAVLGKEKTTARLKNAF